MKVPTAETGSSALLQSGNSSSLGEALQVIAQRDPRLFAAIPEGRRIIDFRNLLTHEYLNVSDRIVWGAIQTDLPILVQHCTQLLSELNQEAS